MGQTNGVLGGVLPMMIQPSSVVGEVGTFLVRPQLALRPVRDRAGEVEAWQARADLPWHWAPGRSPTDVAMVSLHASPVSSQAVTGACQGLIDLGEANDVDDESLDRVACIADACEGATWEQLAEEYGPENATAAGHIVGSFFGGIARSFRRAVRPKNLFKFATKATRFIPGVGPVASMALEHASPMLQRTLLSQKHRAPKGRRVVRMTPAEGGARRPLVISPGTLDKLYGGG
jgi:hypothetical protein